MTTAAAPAFSTASASAVAGASDDPAPRRILTVSGIGTPSAMPRTRRSSLAGFLSSAAPKPRFHVSRIGHPQLRSRKSAPWSAASRPAFTPSAIWFVAICTPKSVSLSCRRRRRRAPTGFRRSANRANTISLTVTAHPNSSTHRRRKGRLPPFVSGARKSSPEMRAWKSATAASLTRRAQPPRPSGTSAYDLRPSKCGPRVGVGTAFSSTVARAVAAHPARDRERRTGTARASCETSPRGVSRVQRRIAATRTAASRAPR